MHLAKLGAVLKADTAFSANSTRRAPGQWDYEVAQRREHQADNQTHAETTN